MQAIIDKINNLQEEDKHEEILTIIDELLKEEKYKDNFELIGFKGRALNNLQKAEEAREVFFSVKEQGENDIRWNYRVGYSYWIEERCEEVIPYALKTLKLIKEQNWNVNNIESDTVYMLSWAYNYLGKFEDNYNLYMEYKNEDSIDWHLDVAESLLRMDNYKEACNYFESAKEKSIQKNDMKNFKFILRSLMYVYPKLERYDDSDRIKEEYPEIWNEIYEDVYSYNPKEKEEVVKYLNNKLGEFTIIKDMDDDFPKIDLLVFEPTPERNHYVISTMGMGHSIMRNMPEELINQGYGRLELLVALPSDWNLHSKEEKDSWPLEWLKLLAKWPFRSDVWLGWGHTIPNGKPFANNTKMFCMILVDPVEYDSDFTVFLENGQKIMFLQMLPIYEEEMEYKLKHKAEGLLKLFGANFSNVIDIKRKNYAIRFGFAGSNKNKWKN